MLIASGQTATVGYGFVTQNHEVVEVRNQAAHMFGMTAEFLVMSLVMDALFALDR